MARQRSLVGMGVLTVLAAGIFSILGLLLSHTVSASPTCTSNWVGGASSNPNDWGTAKNWSPSKVPTASDFVCMSASPTNTAITISSSTTANAAGIDFPASGSTAPSLTVDGPLNLGADASTVDNLTVDYVGADNGSITGTKAQPSLTVTGTGTLENAYLTNLDVIVTGTTSVVKADDVSLETDSTLEVASGGTLALGDGSSVESDSTDTFTIDDGGTLKYNGSATGDTADIDLAITINGAVTVNTATLAFNDQGVLGSTASASTTGTGVAALESTFTAGPSGGTLTGFTVYDTYLSGGTFTIPAGKTATLDDSDLTGTVLDNAGTLDLTAAEGEGLQNASSIDNTGTISFGIGASLSGDGTADLLTNEQAGTLAFKPNPPNSNDTASINSLAIADNGTADVTAGQLQYTGSPGGTVGPDQNVTGAGEFVDSTTLSPTGGLPTSTGSLEGITIIDGGYLSGPGTLTIPSGDTVSWADAELDGSAYVVNNGTLDIPSNYSLDFTGGSTLENEGTSSSPGMIEIATGASIDEDGSGDTLINDPTGIIEAEGTNSTAAIYYLDLTNNGTLEAPSSGSQLTLDDNTTTVGPDATATGTVLVSGTVQPPAAAPQTGSIAGLTFENDSVLTGPGTLTIPSTATVNLDGPYIDNDVVVSNAGSLVFDEGDTDIDTSATIDNTGQITFDDDASLNADDSTDTEILNGAAGTITFKGTSATQTASLNAPISNAGTVEAQEGTFNVWLLQSSFPEQGTSGDGTLTGGTYEVNGTLDITTTSTGGSSGEQGSPDLTTNAATISVGSTGVVETSSGDDANALDELATNSATGSLTTSAKLALTQKFASSGTLNIDGGTFSAPGITLSGNGVTTVGSGATLEAGTSGSGTITLAVPTSGALPELTGAGTVEGTIANGGGNVQPLTGAAGALTNTGNYTQTPATGGAPALTIGIESAGSTAGTDFGQLAVSGTATLGGTLAIVPSAGYTATLGDTFTILTAKSVTGHFASITGSQIGTTGLWFAVSYTATTVVLTVAKPSVTGITPNPLGQGASAVPVTISGLGFVAGDTVSSPNAGVTFTKVVVDAGGQAITADATVSATATTGATGITVTPTSGTALKCSSCLTIDAKPTVTKPSSASPTIIGTGATNKSVTVTGTGFKSPTSHPLTVSFGGVGTTVTGKISGTVTSTSFTMLVTVPKTATTGLYNLTVHNGDYGIGGCTACIKVEILPTVTKFTPAKAGRGASGLPVTITGTNFTASPTIKCSHAGVTFSSVVMKSATQITAKMAVSTTATTGLASITVTDKGQGSGTLASGVTIDLAPAPKSLSPSSLPQNSSAKVVKLSGSAFQSGAKVAFSGTGVTDTLTSLTSTTIELKVTVSKTAAIAKYSVTVTDPDGGKATCTNCFSVTKAAGPRLPAAVRAPATRSAHVGTSEVATRTVGRSAVTLRFPARLAAVTSRRAATGIDRTFGVRLQ